MKIKFILRDNKHQMIQKQYISYPVSRESDLDFLLQDYPLCQTALLSLCLNIIIGKITNVFGLFTNKDK